MFILRWPRWLKRAFVVAVDVMLCFVAVWLAFCLRLGQVQAIDDELLRLTLISIALAVPIFSFNGLYLAIYRFSGWPAVLAVGRAIVFYSLFFGLLVLVIGLNGVPRTIGVLQPLVLFFLIAGSRLFARVTLGASRRRMLLESERPSVIVYGAGLSGQELANTLVSSGRMRLLGFFDDDVRLQGRKLNGLPIFSPNELTNLVVSYGLSHVLLAMPSLPQTRRNMILRSMEVHRVKVHTVPSISEIMFGKVDRVSLKELEMEDLLGRDLVEPDYRLVSSKLRDKVVLVSGAGGSIGSELCRHLVMQNPAVILLVDINEYGLYTLSEELFLAKKYGRLSQDVKIQALLCSIQDEERISQIFAEWRPSLVFHAAAYKHVNLVETNVIAGVKNNIFGSLVMAQQSVRYDVDYCVLISSDKAVRPTSVMGATKRVSELIFQALSQTGGKRTKFSMVRFGNVIESSGSVIPKFRRQIRDGGPITVTDAEVTRFFMTIPEAVQLVLQATALSQGGEVFVLDMGQPIKILDLARRMINLSGLSEKTSQEPDGDIEIIFTGLRPGEKLYEELLLGNNPETTSHPKILMAKEEFLQYPELMHLLSILNEKIKKNSVPEVVEILTRLSKEFKPHPSTKGGEI